MVTEQAGQTLSFSPDIAHVTLNFVDQDLANTGHTATVIGVSASGNTAGLLPGALGTAELMSFFHVDNVVKTCRLEQRHHQHHLLRARSRLRLSGGRRAARHHLCDPAQRQCRRHHHAECAGDGDRHQRRAGLSVRTGYRAPREGAGRRSGRRSYRRRRSPFRRHRSHRYAHGLDHGDGDAFGRRRGPDFRRRVAGGIFRLAGPGFDRASSRRGRLAIRACEHVDQFSQHRRDADADLSGHDRRTPRVRSTPQNVTITILGTNDPVVITSGPQSSTVTEFADTTGSAAIDTTPTVPAGTLAFTDYRYRRYPHRRGDARFDLGSGGTVQRPRPISRRRSRRCCMIPPAPAPAASTGISRSPTRISIFSLMARP